MRLLHPHFHRGSFPSLADAIDELYSVGHARTPISGLTHNFYKYPACFPPILVRRVIQSFTKPGDTVFDPFMGGGTTAVEALHLGRGVVGTDINDLAIFASRFKTLSLRQKTVQALEEWYTRVSRLNLAQPAGMRPELFPPEYFKGISLELSRALFVVKRSISRLEMGDARLFATGVLLQSARLCLDNTELHPSAQGFRRILINTFDNCLDEAILHNTALKGKKGLQANFFKGDVSDSEFIEMYGKSTSRAKLVFTSPPYPGISVLYNRWQINGRVEVSLPYWIIDSEQLLPASYYSMGYPKSKIGLEKYYSTIRAAFRNIKKATNRKTLVVQVVAFPKKREYLFLFLDAMSDAGYVEIKNLTKYTYDRRIWREVPKRRWYTSVNEHVSGRREVVLFFAQKTNRIRGNA